VGAAFSKLVTIHSQKRVKREHGRFRQWYVPPEYKLDVREVKTTDGDKHKLTDSLIHRLFKDSTFQLWAQIQEPEKQPDTHNNKL
jgi:hypothetical protein